MKVYIFVGFITFSLLKPGQVMPPVDEYYYERNIGELNPYEIVPGFSDVDEDESDATSWELEGAQRPMENPALFQGDIIITNPSELMNGIVEDWKRWPNRIVIYSVDKSLNKVMSLIKSAMHHISSRTCIRFKERTHEKDYIYLHRGSGCSSNWGKTGGKQYVSLAHGCHIIGTVIHELMHAIGFLHEQSRSDRDDYITIYWKNIIPGLMSNFKKMAPHKNRLFTPFDTNSIMLYGSSTFAVRGRVSMTFKNGSIIPEVFSKKSLSNLDVQKIRKLYQCK